MTSLDKTSFRLYGKPFSELNDAETLLCRQCHSFDYIDQKSSKHSFGNIDKTLIILIIIFTFLTIYSHLARS